MYINDQLNISGRLRKHIRQGSLLTETIFYEIRPDYFGINNRYKDCQLLTIKRVFFSQILNIFFMNSLQCFHPLVSMLGRVIFLREFLSKFNREQCEASFGEKKSPTEILEPTRHTCFSLFYSTFQIMKTTHKPNQCAAQT